jgi:DNA repair protein RecN (Recombination protein N)
MLAELEIRDLALLSGARLSLRPGLVCLTGATGVGKSLVLEAVHLLAGGRASAEVIRTGAAAAVVRGLFQVSPERAALVAEALSVEVPPEGEFLLERRVEAGGRGRASCNGSPLTVALLRQAAPLLVEVHGQSEHQSLLDPVVQARLLDRAGGCEAAREKFAEALRAARDARDRRDALEARRRERRARLDFVEHSIEVIASAAIQPGELALLEEERRRFDGAERFLGDLHGAVEALDEGDGSAVERLGQARRAAQRASELDRRLESSLESIEAALAAASQASLEIARIRDGSDFDPGRRAEVEERLETLRRVLRAHGPDEEQALESLARARAEEKTLRAEEEDDGAAEDRLTDARNDLARAGKELVKLRRAAARTLAAGVLEEFRDLALGEARFEVEVETGEIAAGASSAGSGDDGSVADPLDRATASGPGPVRFLFSANPGEPLLPLARVASGGELARVALAVKTRLAGADGTPVLVFDEVDAEVGGRLGPAVAARLRAVAVGRQVLVVTHLPSIAAAADLHLRVTKEVRDGRTEAKVEPLEGEEREKELAEMLRGEGLADRGREAARELLDEARRPGKGR